MKANQLLETKLFLFDSLWTFVGRLHVTQRYQYFRSWEKMTRGGV